MEGATGSVIITASAPGFTDRTGIVGIVAPALQLTGLPPSLTSLDPTDTFAVQVGVPAGASPNTFVSPAQAVRVGGSSVTVTVTNSNGAIARLVTQAGSAQSRTVTIAPGQSSSPATVAAGGIAFDPIGGGNTIVQGTAPGFTATDAASQPVTVTASGITLFSLPATVGSGLQYGFFSGQLLGSEHGGVTVHLESSNPALMRLSVNATTAGTPSIDIPLANGEVSFNYYIHGMEGAIGDATITASAPGFVNQTGIVHVVQPAFQIESLPASTASTAASDAFHVRVGLPDASNNFVALAQAARAGTSLTVTITNSDASVAQLVTLAGGAQSRSITVAAGQSSSPSTVGAGGIEFDPLSAGTTTVSASIPGFITTTAGTITVEVTGEEEEAPEAGALAQRFDPPAPVVYEQFLSSPFADLEEHFVVRTRMPAEHVAPAAHPVMERSVMPLVTARTRRQDGDGRRPPGPARRLSL